ncbi:MAG: hydroxyacylglutathione hydrolase [Chloroflexia bacterium]|jgi:glyoxylase-like metal-dependent hydrolase (beta-lactamase superfamily II)|nr:hydroxyacylglutathione hydrolase [Chloroflexia bacterium]
MIVRPFGGGPFDTTAYLVYDHIGGTGIIVDAPLGSTRKIAQVVAESKVEVPYVVSTHGHWDNNADNVAMCEAVGAQLCAHFWDATRLANPGLTSDVELASKVKPSKADRHLGDGEMMEVGDLKFEVWHTPGHTPGSICLYEAAHGSIFTGDTLLRMGIGRTDGAGGNKPAMQKTIERLAQLPDDTRVYPGHGLATTIKAERWLLDIVTAGS